MKPTSASKKRATSPNAAVTVWSTRSGGQSISRVEIDATSASNSTWAARACSALRSAVMSVNEVTAWRRASPDTVSGRAFTRNHRRGSPSRSMPSTWSTVGCPVRTVTWAGSSVTGKGSSFGRTHRMFGSRCRSRAGRSPARRG